MVYCPSCGNEVAESAEFCRQCGEELQPVEQSGSIEGEPSPEPHSPRADIDEDSRFGPYKPTNWKIGVTGAVFGLLIGFLCAWATFNLGGSAVFFLIGWVGSAIYLWRKPTVSGTIGSGLYISAIVLVLLPIVFYIPYIAQDADTARETGQQIGGTIGIVVWGFVFLLIAIVAAGIGYFFKKHEKKKLQARPG
jgi:hypothetical protein